MRLNSNKLVGAILARNENGPDRYLKLVLDNMLRYCDHIVALDDGSDDGTPETLQDMGCEVLTRQRGAGDVYDVSGGFVRGFWGLDEVTPRARLWDAAMRAAGPGGWVYIADADHELVGITPDDLRTCLRSEAVTAWALPLWDIWNPDGTLMRADGYWQAHRRPRPWLFRHLPGFVPSWTSIGRKTVHTGHFPPNFPLVAGQLPGAAIRHWSYAQPAHRAVKRERYLALA